MVSITLENVSVEFPIYNSDRRLLRQTFQAVAGMSRIRHHSSGQVSVKALHNIDLAIREGDRVGLIGLNGAGKTTLLRTLAGVYKPSSGTLRRSGRVAPLFDIGLGLDMEATGYENIYLKGLLLGMSRQEIRQKLDDIAEFTELGEYLGMPVRTYSSGMLLRLAFAVCTSVQPEIILMDEWIGVGDSHFLKKATARLRQFVNQSSILVLASHSDALIREVCSKCLLMNQGHVVAYGDAGDVLHQYSLFGPAPFFDPKLYLKANPDVATSELVGQTPWFHFMAYGVFEARDLGNGIRLSDFAEDPVFAKAVAEKDTHTALMRIVAVAPFLPDFQRPAGWKLDRDSPLPVDFVPLPGKYLILPPGYEVPAGSQAPDGLFLSEETPDRPGNTHRRAVFG